MEEAGTQFPNEPDKEDLLAQIPQLIIRNRIAIAQADKLLAEADAFHADLEAELKESDTRYEEA
jgi:hypothetical protein